jgi:peroxiredoxin
MTGKHWKTTLAMALLLASAAILINSSISKQSAETRTAAITNGIASGNVGPQLGNIAPDFQLAKMDGAKISLADLRGKPAVIVFWSTWCSVCEEETPRINGLAAEYAGKGVQVLGINIKDSVARTESGVKDFGIKFAVARDADGGVARAYRVMGTPTIVFLDRKGVVRYFGNELPDDYARRLDALVAESV